MRRWNSVLSHSVLPGAIIICRGWFAGPRHFSVVPRRGMGLACAKRARVEDRRGGDRGLGGMAEHAAGHATVDTFRQRVQEMPRTAGAGATWA